MAAEVSYDVLLTESRLADNSSQWTALHPQLPGCNATGLSQEEAFENLAKSRDAWLKVAAELGEGIPQGSESPVFTAVYAPVPGANRVTLPEATESQVVPAAA